MSNVNNYAFANKLEQWKQKVLDPQETKVKEAKVIMEDKSYPWRDDEQRKVANAKLIIMSQWLQFYQDFYFEALKLVEQHETLVNNLSKWYDIWYANISNDGKQEAEMMNAQADMLAAIFGDIYKELLPLKLDIKPPKALNI